MTPAEELEGPLADALEAWARERQKEFGVALAEDLRALVLRAAEQADMNSADEVERLTAYTRALEHAADAARERLEGRTAP